MDCNILQLSVVPYSLQNFAGYFQNSGIFIPIFQATEPHIITAVKQDGARIKVRISCGVMEGPGCGWTVRWCTRPWRNQDRGISCGAGVTASGVAGFIQEPDLVKYPPVFFNGDRGFS